jgi:hypothetical protein
MVKRRKPLRVRQLQTALWFGELLTKDFDSLGVDPLKAGFSLEQVTGVKHER